MSGIVINNFGVVRVIYMVEIKNFYNLEFFFIMEV